jgi:nitrogen-specific signal transduction histidine kinase
MIQAVLNIVRNAMQAISSQNELRLGRITCAPAPCASSPSATCAIAW